MYEVVIFDFFGVFCPDITLEWFRKAVPDHVVKLSEFQAICTKSDYGKLAKADFYEEVARLANISTTEIVRGVEAEIFINSNLVEYVRKLRQHGWRTACLSNGTHEWTLDVITRYGLRELFDEVVLSGDLGIIKPDPDIYIYTLQRLHASAGQAIFIDDREINVEAAETCGIRSLLYIDTAAFVHDFEQLTAPAL